MTAKKRPARKPRARRPAAPTTILDAIVAAARAWYPTPALANVSLGNAADREAVVAIVTVGPADGEGRAYQWVAFGRDTASAVRALGATFSCAVHGDPARHRACCAELQRLAAFVDDDAPRDHDVPVAPGPVVN